MSAKRGGGGRAQYEELEALSLFCPRCRTAMPVRQRLLLVLPDGDLYEYRCVQCHTVVGRKKGTTTMPSVLPADLVSGTGGDRRR